LMFLRINLSSDDFMIVRIFDDFITQQKWFNYFCKHPPKYFLKKDSSSLEKHLITDQEIDIAWQGIKDGLLKIQKFGLAFPYKLENTFSGDQKILNDLHRFFTHNELFGRNHYWEDQSLINIFDNKFQFPNISYDTWLDTISKINDGVHFLEKVTITTNKNYIQSNYEFLSFNFTPINRYHKQINWLKFEESELITNYKYNYYNDFENIVLLDQSITGKSVLRSFYDEDDPTQFDCTGRLGSSGGFTIDIDHARRKIYSSDQFASWCKRFGTTPSDLPLEFPIGTIIKSTSNILQLFESALDCEVTIDFLQNF